MNEIGFRQSYIHELASILGYVAAIFLFILSLDEYIYVHVARLEESTTSHICIYTCMITPVGGGRLIVYMYLQIQVALDGIELLSELINLGLLLFEGLETTGVPELTRVSMPSMMVTSPVMVTPLAKVAAPVASKVPPTVAAPAMAASALAVSVWVTVRVSPTVAGPVTARPAPSVAVT